MNAFQFPANTVAEVQELYPSLPVMVQLATDNNPRLISYLEGSYLTGVDNRKVLAAVTINDFNELKALAAIEIRKQQLYTTCREAYSAFSQAQDPFKKTA